ncbi:MAG: FecR domain-containing protein [Spirochaetota bacterium]
MKFWSNATSTKKNSKKEWLLPTVLIANIVVFASLFFYDLNSSIGIGSRKEIGFVTFKKNAIQRKFDSSVVWINVGSNSPLANRDTLRTFENSDAVITLKNGTEIDVDQNSMIYIDIKDSKPKIKFEEGSIQVRKNKQNATSGITIESGGNLIKVGDAEAKIEKLAGEDLALYVNKG